MVVFLLASVAFSALVVVAPLKVAGAPAVNAVDGRSIRLIEQSDFVYVSAGARVYSVALGVGSKGSLGSLTEMTTRSWYPLFSGIGDYNRDTRDDWFDAGRQTLNVTLSASTPSLPGQVGTVYNIASYSSRYTTIQGLAVGDWSGDGYSDAIVGTYAVQYGYYVFHIFLGSSGAPSGQLYQTSTFAEAIRYVAAGDFNADGRDDLAVIVQGTSYLLRVYLSASTSSCVACWVYGYTATLSYPPVGLAMGDWDRDGISDVVATEQLSASSYRFSIGFGKKGTANGETLPLTPLGSAVSARPYYVSLGDWNADGRHDLFHLYPSGSNWEAKVTYSAATPSSRAAVGATSTVLTFYYTSIYAFALGDWTGDSTRAYYDGFTGSRTVSVPVALLMPPPYEKGVTNSASGKAIFAAGTLSQTTYTGSVRLGASFMFAVGAYASALALAEIEAKVEVELEAGITFQLGYSQGFSTEMSYEIGGTVLDQGPVVMVVDIPYTDYRYQIVNAASSLISFLVDDFAISVPSRLATDYVLRPVYLSEYNDPLKKPADMPTINDSNTHKIGNLRSYTLDDQYTASCSPSEGCWISPTAVGSYLGSGNAVMTFQSGVTFGWGVDFKISLGGKIEASIEGATVEFESMFSLGVEFMADYTYTNIVSIGGKAGELLKYDTDIYASGYEKFGYQYNAYVRRLNFFTSQVYPIISVLVLDWKAHDLNEGYPVVPTLTGVTKSTASLSWTLANDYIHSAGYIVEYSTSATFKGMKQSPQLSRDTLSYTITGLSAGKTYYIRIRGLYTSGFANLSIVVIAKTPRR